MLERFGPQHWWPGDGRHEIMVGAILTQNTNWMNVTKAIDNLKRADVMDPIAIHKMDVHRLAQLIRPAGYFNVKARRLKSFHDWLIERTGGDLAQLDSIETEVLREELLTISGVGRETADSILLYALDRPTFVVDAYTGRILFRHYLIDVDADYEYIKDVFEANLPRDLKLFNEYHALLVRTGKEFCKPTPLCEGCPLEGLPHDIWREAY